MDASSDFFIDFGETRRFRSPENEKSENQYVGPLKTRIWRTNTLAQDIPLSVALNFCL
jgi:hypothetical protein